MTKSYEDRISDLMLRFELYGADFTHTTQDSLKLHKFYYTVPEKIETLTFTMDGAEYQKFIKRRIIDILMSTIDSRDEEFLNECLKIFEDTIICFSKIRYGEIWNSRDVLNVFNKIKYESVEFNEV